MSLSLYKSIYSCIYLIKTTVSYLRCTVWWYLLQYFSKPPYNHCLCFAHPDVYSYDEDDMVLDSKLPEHLSHFGIDMMTMEKVSSRFFFFWR